MIRKLFTLAIVVCLLGAGWSSAHAQQTPTVRFFDETGHNVKGTFLKFYNSNNDALFLYGYPITEENGFHDRPLHGDRRHERGDEAQPHRLRRGVPVTGKTRSRSKGEASTVAAAARAEDTVAAHRGGGEADLAGITELARELGISQRAIRLYEARGLLTPRRINGGRAYSRRDRVRLALIVRGRAVGMSLAEIEHILSLYGDHGEGRARQLEYLLRRIEEAVTELESRRANIETTLAELRVIHGNLRRELESRRRAAKK